jgi:hypothetical protein
MHLIGTMDRERAFFVRGEAPPTERLISETDLELWQRYLAADAGSTLGRALLEVLCLRDTIGRMIRQDLQH